MVFNVNHCCLSDCKGLLAFLTCQLRFNHHIHVFICFCHGLYVEKGGEPIFLGETEGVIIKAGYIH